MNKMKPKTKGVLPRLFKMIFRYYPVMLPITLGCMVISACVNAIPAIFLQKVIAVLQEAWETSNWNWSEISPQIFKIVFILVGLYITSLTTSFIFNQLIAIMTQGTLKKIRSEMFNKMQSLPIKYFDTHNHGDIMSHYTNDIDTLRQMISQSMPQLMMSGIVVTAIFLWSWRKKFINSSFVDNPTRFGMSDALKVAVI